MSFTNNVIGIAGRSTGGKSSSLMGIPDPEGVVYLNCEAGKPLPFAHNYFELIVKDPKAITKVLTPDANGQYTLFKKRMPDGTFATPAKPVHTVIIDTITMALEMYVSVHVNESNDSRGEWGQLAEWFIHLMQQRISTCPFNVILLAHTAPTEDVHTGKIGEVISVPGKKLAKNGIERYFTNIVHAKRMDIETLDQYPNDLLNITEEEREYGYKYVFQTRPTKDAINDGIRSNRGLYSRNETFIDNNVMHVINRLNQKKLESQ